MALATTTMDLYLSGKLTVFQPLLPISLTTPVITLGPGGIGMSVGVGVAVGVLVGVGVGVLVGVGVGVGSGTTIPQSAHCSAAELLVTFTTSLPSAFIVKRSQ